MSMRLLLLITLLGCAKSTRDWSRPKGLAAEEAVVSTNAALELLYSQGFESERLDAIDSSLRIKSSINGVSKKLILDTASTFTVAFQNHVERFGLLTGEFEKERNPWILTWFDVHKNMKPALARSFVVAGFEYSPWVFGCLPGGYEHPLLGSDFFHWTQAVVFTRFGILAFSPGAKPAKNMQSLLESHGYVALKMMRTQNQSGVRIMREPGKALRFGVPYVPVVVNGHSGTMFVDTGAFTSLIYKNRVENRVRDFYRYQSYGITDASGRSSGAYGLIIENIVIGSSYRVSTGTHFTVGDVTERNKRMLEKGLKPDKDDLGALGLDFLIDHNAIIDMGNMMLYLRFR